jgi:hypothetical protein
LKRCTLSFFKVSRDGDDVTAAPTVRAFFSILSRFFQRHTSSAVGECQLRPVHLTR